MITGYSVNDTIVVLDRIRENLALMRRETFSRIINTSINHVLSRTVLTSFTTWMVVVILYIFTIRSSTGIENLAFPLIVGIIVGTYSSIYIASPVLLFWYRKTKPQIAT
jgi:preprotein translocase subunit SecF